jgi:hypothetical protein
MTHLWWLRLVMLVLAMSALYMNGILWMFIRRNRRLEKQMRASTKQTIVDAWRGGMEEAARVVGTLAERPYSTEPECSAILHAEQIIHERIREMQRRSQEWLTSESAKSSQTESSLTTKERSLYDEPTNR